MTSPAPRYDAVLIVDWSGGADRGATPKKDAIWIAEAQGGASSDPVYCRNREVALAYLCERLAAAEARGARLLVGFDFPFGYPEGFAEKLTGKADTFAVWDWFDQRLTDLRDGKDRWAVAAEANRAFEGEGPFWFFSGKDAPEGLARTKPGAFPVSEWRVAEGQAKGAFSCWQLGGAGAVGSQAIMGFPVLKRLRAAFDLAVWPFEPMGAARHGIIEVWPSLIAQTVADEQQDGEIKDAAQVRVLAEKISALPPADLARMLDVEAPEEGWIFGLGHEALLRGDVPALSNDCFALPRGVDWTPVSEALGHLRDSLSPVVGQETCAFSALGGRVLAQDAMALRANPPAANTAVDGYGFAGSLAEGEIAEFALHTGRAAAGAPFEGQVPEGAALRILTGAALPSGVQTVVLEEDCKVAGGVVRFRGPLKRGANTRRAGEDVAEGDVALAKGTKVGPAELALLAAVGVQRARVYRPLKVAILSTGDELRPAGEAVAPGQISDANGPMLARMVSSWGMVPVVLGIAGDDRETVRDAFDRARREADVLITSGGASAGDEDHVSALLKDTGTMQTWRIAIKPGRPLALGLWDGMPVFGLPGNPVAAMVCAAVFARPSLGLMAGAGWQEPQGFMVPAAFSKTKKPGRVEYLRARIVEGRAEVFASEGSGRISGLAWADGLVRLPHEAVSVTPGTMVEYLPWASFGL